MSIHDGHRQRLRERYIRDGMDSFTDVQVLEMLLFYCIPRKDTNLIAHALLKEFGSLDKVLQASPEELCQVQDIGPSAAAYLTLFRSVERYCGIHCRQEHAVLTNVGEYGRYLVPYFLGKKNECVYLLALDAKCKVLCCKEVGEGSVNSAAVPIRRVVEMALAANATTVILAHNHPSGLAIPSGDDVQTTRRLAMALDAVGIELVDHVVVAEQEFVSMAQSGYYRPEDCRALV